MGPDHAKLLEEYAEKLGTLMPLAIRAYDDGVSAARRAGAVDPAAVAEVRRGPVAAHPRIIALIREYFFACSALNRRKEAEGIDEYVEPDDFVFSHLESEAHYELWNRLCDLPYFPIGTDGDGRPV